MTSAEFAAKYRVLKTLTEHGARSQIAQEVALGRMVMVHHLDVGSAADQQRTLARLTSLDPAASAKIFDVADVDGTKVIVTHFLASFTDLPTWLDQNSDAGEVKTLIGAQRPASPPPAKPSEGGFTSIFGGVHAGAGHNAAGAIAEDFKLKKWWD